jgi:hypothetical protein
MSPVLRDLFQERSAIAPVTVRQEQRLDAVRHRIARARRRRAAGAAGGLGVVLAATATIAVAGHGSDVAPPGQPPTTTTRPTPSAASIEGFPTVLEGARILAAASVAIRPGRSGTLRLQTAATAEVAFFARCSPQIDGVYVRLVWPAGNESTVPCGGSLRWYDRNGLSHLGISPGEPATVRFRVTADPARAESPSSGTIAVAVGERLPAGEVPQPPAPSTLPPLPRPPADADVVTTIRNRPGQPLAPRVVRIDWQPHLQFFVLMQTPGDVRVRLDGEQFMRCEKWDYSPPPAPPRYVDGCGEERILEGSAKGGKPGDTLTVTVLPARVTGDWAVVVTRPKYGS